MEGGKLNGAPHCVGMSYPQFQPNGENLTKNGNNGFLRYRLKLTKPSSDSKIKREVLTTFLTSIQGDGGGAVNAEFAEKFADAEICYNDLANLIHKDLELLGFESINERNELMKFFSQLPNQDTNYDNICNLKEAVTYNKQILVSLNNHLLLIVSVLSATDCKLQIMPPRDVIIDDKSFASRFVIKGLNKLMYVIDGITEGVHRLKFGAMDKQEYLPHTKKLNNRKFFIVGPSVCCVGALLAIYYWKFRK